MKFLQKNRIISEHNTKRKNISIFHNNSKNLRILFNININKALM